jgi:VanZ family protein
MKMNQNKKRVIFYVVILFWLSIIFVLSSQPVSKSNALSKKITEIVINSAERAAPNSNFDFDRTNHLIRKNAHFFSYLILGILIINLMKKSKMGRFKIFIISISFCIVYAISDEFHQIFVSGRGAQIKDVLIDSAGSLMGIAIYEAISKIKKNKY